MRNSYSPDWKSSKKPAKQRKYRANAPLHIKRKFMAAVLNKKLREAHRNGKYQDIAICKKCIMPSK